VDQSHHAVHYGLVVLMVFAATALARGFFL
jgi:hypothetical protein